jgi:predicted negative regulator of RcsB-dependent stress response
MAQHLDLEEQEQLDQLKHFWKQYGNLITWTLIVVLGAFASWNGYQYWQRNQAARSAALYEELDRAAKAGDLPKLERAFADIKEKFGGTDYAQQAGLLVAKVFFENGKADAAKEALVWVADKSGSLAYRSVAKLRLAAVLAGDKAYDDALKQLSGEFPKEFDGLVADRKGDVLALQGKSAQARTAYQQAYAALPIDVDYRRLVEFKLSSLGGETLPVQGAVQATGAGSGPASTQ